ncbi:MAG: type IV pilus assembly protein PilE [Lentisphaeria bacterium]|jgi:type IV pilus assembly protein PilE
MNKKKQGFTLVELMITVAIIAIIAAVALPAYNNTVKKSRRSDGTGALSEAASMQERIYSESQSYVDNSGLSRLVVNGDGVSSREGYYTLAVTNSCSASAPFDCYTITASAVGSQAADTDCATFTINHLGQKTSSPNTSCW